MEATTKPLFKERLLSKPLRVDDPKELGDEDSKFVELDGVLIHYKLTEKPCVERSLTLVLMHGFSGQMHNFELVWPHWEKEHQILAWDRPCWGLSARVVQNEDGTWPTRSGQNPYTYKYSAMLLRLLLDHCGLLNVGRTLVLIGHSHGGASAATILCQYDEDLRRNVFGGCILVNAPITRWPSSKLLGGLAEKKPERHDSIVNAGAGIFRFIHQRVDRGPLPVTYRVKNWRKAWVKWSAVNVKPPVIDLSKLQEIPTLDIRGAADRVVDPQQVGDLKPFCDLSYIIDGADHGSLLGQNEEHAQEFRHIVDSFLDQIAVLNT